MQLPIRTEHATVGEMPLVIVCPERPGKFPVIVGLHGLMGNKETMLPLAEPLAAAGFVVALPDARFHGARYDARWVQDAQTNESLAVLRSVTETAVELPALLDALAVRDDVAAGGAGIMGVSMGALTLYAAVPREPRFTVAAALIGGGIFDHPPAQQAALAPEARATLDTNDIRNHLDAFAPVALLLLAGADDMRLPAAGTQALYDALRPRIADASRLRLVIEPRIGHEVTFAMGMETLNWFQRWLR